jgi:hypothetical protein
LHFAGSSSVFLCVVCANRLDVLRGPRINFVTFVLTPGGVVWRRRLRMQLWEWHWRRPDAASGDSAGPSGLWLCFVQFSLTSM